MSTENLIEKATYKTIMQSECPIWVKFLSENKIAVRDVYNVFASKYPNTLTYVGFIQNLKDGSFSYENYIKTKEIFVDMQERIESEIKKLNTNYYLKNKAGLYLQEIGYKDCAYVEDIKNATRYNHLEVDNKRTKLVGHKLTIVEIPKENYS